MRQVLVMYVGPDGVPRAYALGPEGRRGFVADEARFHLEAYLAERAVIGDPMAEAKFIRREEVLA